MRVTTKNIEKKWLEALLKWLIIILLLPTLYLGLNGYTLYEKVSISIICITVVIYNLISSKNVTIPLTKKYEMLIFWGSIALFFDLQVYYKLLVNRSELHKLAIIGVLCFNFCFLIWLRKTQINVNLISIKNYFYRSWNWMLPALFFLVLNYNIWDLWIKSDGYIYYINLLDSLGKWDFSLSGLTSFQLAGHISYAYSMIWSMGAIIFGEIGVRIANMIMAVITIYAFNKIATSILKKATKVHLFLITAIFAFAPLFFGISYEISSDYAVFCFFIWMVYAHVYQKNVLRVYFSVLLCFSKEIGPLILFGYLVGEFVSYFFEQKNKVLKIIQNYLKSTNWLNAYGGILFLIYFLWGGVGWANASLSTKTLSGRQGDTFRIDFEYIVYKLKELYVMNFAWLVFLIVFLGIVFKIIYKKRLKINKNLLALVFSYCVFVSFNLFYFTYGNYRYIQLNWFFLSLLLGYFIVYFYPRILAKYFLIILLVTFFVESYVVVDPFTYQNFDSINVGKIDVITTKKYASVDGLYLTKEESPYTETQVFFDSLLYNRQQISLETLTERAFREIDYKTSKLVILPPVFNSETLYTFRGMFGRPEIDSYYWDANSGNITDIPTETPITFIDLFDILDSDIYNNENIYYLQYPYKANYDEDYYLSQFQILDSIAFEHQGWSMNVLVLRKA